MRIRLMDGIHHQGCAIILPTVNPDMNPDMNPAVNPAVMAGIYIRAARIATGATTSDPAWWADLQEATDFLLREARGEVTRPDGCPLPSLGSLALRPTPAEVNISKIGDRIAVRAFIGGVELWVTCPGSGDGRHCVRHAVAKAQEIGAEVVPASAGWETART